MVLQQASHPDGTMRVENIGGITESTVSFSPGVTILVGRNATNRTSFLQAVMAALGSDDTALKGNTDKGSAELTLGEETHTRHLQRRANAIVTDGDPYLDDPELAELFAFLLESNDARRAVATDADLRELIMRPVDTDAIETEIDQLVQKRTSLTQELTKIDDLKDDLPELEEQRTRLQEQIDEKKDELAAKEQELEAADADIEETRQEQSKLEDTLETLRQKRTSLDDVRYDLETERESHNALQQERHELDVKLTDLPETPVGEINELEAELSRLREHKQTLEIEINELQSVIGFNEEMLEETGAQPFASLTTAETDQEQDGAVTNQLLVDDDVTCWTCGSGVEREQIEATVSQLRERSQSKVSEVNEVESYINDLDSEKSSLEQAQRERERYERRLAELDDELERSEEIIEDLQAQRETLTDEIETVETEVDALDTDDDNVILDLHKEANQLEYELGKLEGDRDRVEREITSIEGRIADQDDIEAQREEVSTEIENLRTKIERLEEEAIEQFNDHMATVLELLNYANLERIWLECTERDVREGRRTVSKNTFELHVIRTTESGAAYEDTIAHLSESEREVTGLVFALAGYLAHEVYEVVPFILLDSLEAIDAERIAALTDYLTEYTGYLLVALLPEDAAALDEEYQRITAV